MRVLLAPDKFRGTFTAAEVCDHIARGIISVAPDTMIMPLPLADGGEGTLDVLLGAFGGTRHSLRVAGPLGDEITAEYGVTLDGVAILESARICGLDLISPALRDPMRATTYGLGQAIASLLDLGVARFLIGLGGTATVDGGIGLARALGFRFPGPDSVDDSLAHTGLTTARFTILCDVDTPVAGPQGAARVFGPQKGATTMQVLLLEERLAALVQGLAAWKGESSEALSILPMGGAAGGLGLGCRLFLGGRLVPGAVFIMETLGFSGKLAETDMLVTGEGSFDSQSRAGKAAWLAVELAGAAGKPTAVVAGRWDGTLPRARPDAFRVFAGESMTNAAGVQDAGGVATLAAAAIRWGLLLSEPPKGT